MPAVPTDMITLMWVVIITLAVVVATLARVGWNRMESDKKKCDEDRRAKHEQTLAFARVMEEVAKRVDVSPTIKLQITNPRDTPTDPLVAQR